MLPSRTDGIVSERSTTGLSSPYELADDHQEQSDVMIAEKCPENAANL